MSDSPTLYPTILTVLQVLSADYPNMNLVPPSDQDGWLGWLIVCLPSLFEGGNMEISRNGQTAGFQWCSKSCSTIQWVAFTHDCKQKVEAVEKGQLISLIYRVYLDEWQVLRLPTSQLDTLSSYKYMRHLLSLPIFMGEGPDFQFARRSLLMASRRCPWGLLF